MIFNISSSCIGCTALLALQTHSYTSCNVIKSQFSCILFFITQILMQYDGGWHINVEKLYDSSICRNKSVLVDIRMYLFHTKTEVQQFIRIKWSERGNERRKSEWEWKVEGDKTRICMYYELKDEEWKRSRKGFEKMYA